jgi:hypothetical protein
LLTNGHCALHCGCVPKTNDRFEDLTGKVFGRLTVLSRAENTKYGGARFWVQCSCKSKPKVVTGKRLTTEDNPTRSCGCLRREANREARLEDLTGQQIDRLEVVRYEPGEEGEVGVWECRCQCGATVKKKAQLLLSLRRRLPLSCGAPKCLADPDFIGPVLPIEVARERGLKHYFPGRKCKKGHFSTHLVSNQSCVLCHLRRGREFTQENPEKISAYTRRHSAKPESKARRNSQLKQRREDDPIYRFVDHIRNRTGRVLALISAKKSDSFGSRNWLGKNVLAVMDRQGLKPEDLEPGKYELDHVQPLCFWPWSQSTTANKLLHLAANSPENLQFLPKEEHRKKSDDERRLYNWCDSTFSTYSDHSKELLELLENGLELPEFLEPERDAIHAELLECAKTKPLFIETGSQ